MSTIELHPTSTRNVNLNVLDEPLSICSCEPMTGWFRDGKCSTNESDQGHHVICAIMSDEFLEFSKESGNDLSTPMPQHGFEGLKAGDHWCLCALRWKQAFNKNKAPRVDLKATHRSALDVVSLDDLKSHALQ